jgi:SAM-dependent methyltransferase
MVAYDKIVDGYHKRTFSPIHQLMEYNYFNIIGNFKNKSILDLACGDGVHTRIFSVDASNIIGMDISEKLINIAQKIEEKNRKYGIPKIKWSQDRKNYKEGASIKITFKTKDGEKLNFNMFYFSKQTYDWAFSKAGFKKVYWHKPQVSSKNIQDFDQKYWQDALDYPFNSFIECIK